MKNVEYVKFTQHQQDSTDDANQTKVPKTECSPEFRENLTKFRAAQYEFVSRRVRPDGVPFLVTKSGHIHDHANTYILSRLFHPTIFNSNEKKRAFQTITNKTAKGEIERLQTWLNICAHQDVRSMDATIEFLHAVIDVYRKGDEERAPLKEESLERYINTWRTFYAYLDIIGIEHQMNFPDKITQTRTRSLEEDNSDFLNYTKSSKDQSQMTYEKDPLIKYDRKNKLFDYTSQVMTVDQVSSLIRELYLIDPVYAVMANVALNTLVRISELIFYWPPERGNKKNKKWKTYAKMRR
jgi:hypothetical protein